MGHQCGALFSEDSGPAICKTRSGFAQLFSMRIVVTKGSEGRVVRKIRQKRTGVAMPGITQDQRGH